MNALARIVATSLKMSLRDRQAIFWNYGFPLGIFFVYGGIFGRFNVHGLTDSFSGLLCITTLGTSFFGVAIGLVRQRERGILRRYRATPLKPWQLITSELIHGYLLLLTTVGMQLILGMLIYNVRISGGLLALFIFYTIGAFTFLTIGLLISAFADNTRAAPAIAQVLFFPFMFLSGTAIRLDMLPQTLQSVSNYIPATYFVAGLHDIIVNGHSLSNNLGNIAALVITLLVGFIFANMLFRWEPEQKIPLAVRLKVAGLFAILLLIPYVIHSFF